jgi:hypothetical protein
MPTVIAGRQRLTASGGTVRYTGNGSVGVEALERSAVLQRRPLTDLARLLPAERYRTTSACAPSPTRVCLFASSLDGAQHVALLADERSTLVFSAVADAPEVRDALVAELLNAMS